MKTYTFHPAAERGQVDFGWLKSAHSFSFGHWYNPEKTRFGLLRVLNDDQVAPAQGFGTHPHDNMEIVSIPLLGDLAHKDSMGNATVIRQNDVQIMTAGTGVQHSEYNHSTTDPVHFLQIWVFPKKRNLDPRYDQKTFSPADRHNRMQTIVSPDGEEGVLINQDAWFSLGKFEAGQQLNYRTHQPGQGVYAFVLSGDVKIDDQPLHQRDALGIAQAEEISLQFSTDSEILLIEVPMD
jgi:redox-sensitive bicupin YhaK (pirin superfamily)